MSIATNKTHTLDPENWVASHGDYLYNFAYSRVHSKDLAEDLVQDTFVAGLKSRDSFQGKSTEITWLVAILKRKVIDHYRKMSSKKEVVSSEFTSPFQKEGIFEGHWIMDRAPRMESGDFADPINRSEFRAIIEKCLTHLPEKWRAVFVLKVIEELSTEEVCKELECTSSNLWVMMHRARLKLRECVEINWLK